MRYELQLQPLRFAATAQDGNVLSEQQYGDHPSMLTFPGVNSCTAITLALDDGRLLGAHLTEANSPEEAELCFAGMQVLQGEAAIRHVLVIYTREIDIDGWRAGSRYRGAMLLSGLSQRFGRASDARCLMVLHNARQPARDYRVLREAVSGQLLVLWRPAAGGGWQGCTPSLG